MKIGGLLLCFAGMALLCGMDAVAKALGAHLTTFQIAFVRYGGAAIWLALYIVFARANWPLRRNWRRHLLRGVLMVTTACLFFYAVTHLPLAIATALAMSAPIYVSLFGIIFLRERPSRILGLAIMLGIAGSAVMVIGGDGDGAATGDFSGWIAGVLAPISYAAAIVLLKHHSDDENAAALSLSTAAVAAAVLLPVSVADFAAPSAEAWLLMGLIGFLGASGIVLLTIGLRTTPASSFAIVDYVSLLWAALFGFLFFSEVPEMRFWIGGALIVSACALGVGATRKRAAVSP
ncbi:MAG TPA: DMT family transporter [Devosiaceae bacterium]|jgi:S-adenosylmethionine uptake transporter|nr:DMT family transporter [Devosiaceae bacterium]